MEKNLEKAIQIAVDAHCGQEDKSGSPYILHPLRVMHTVDTTEAKITAVLHDVVENTDIEFNDLQDAGIPNHILTALELLTRTDDLSYDDYITHLSKNPLAIKVKLADLKDNMNLSRLKEITNNDLDRLHKYIAAYHYLTKLS